MIDVVLGDGFVRVEPEFPETLMRGLTYYHREMVMQGYKKIMSGHYRQLYTVGHTLVDGRMVNYLVTMPGFAKLVKDILTAAGCEFRMVDRRTPFPEPDMMAAMAILRPYQYDGVYTAISSGGGVIACPTGWGKTYVMAAIARAFAHAELCARNTPTIVVAVSDKDIAAQNAESLRGILPERDVGLVMSGITPKFSEDIQVITMDSLHRIRSEDVGIFVGDEVHSAATEGRAEKIMAFQMARKWGLSATPTGRCDGSDLVTDGLFGPIVYRRTYQEGVADGALVPIEVFWYRVPGPAVDLDQYLMYRTRDAKYDRGVYSNPHQNGVCASMLQRMPASLQTLCIMPHLEQMNNIREDIPGCPIVHAEKDANAITAKGFTQLTPVSDIERKAIYQQMRDGTIRKILSTYVYKQGVNFPGLSVTIVAGGGGSNIVAGQIPGRASRNIAGKDGAYVIDFWHDWDKAGKKVGPILKDDKSRDKVYEELGFKRTWVRALDEIPILGK